MSFSPSSSETAHNSGFLELIASKHYEHPSIDPNRITLRYGVVQGMLWAAFLPITYSSTFLLSRGISGTQIGTMLMCGNLLAIMLQTIVSQEADYGDTFTIRRMSAFFAALTALFMTTALFIDAPIILMALFALCYMTGRNTQALANSISVYYINRGAPLNYSIARSAGSITWSLTAMVLGRAMAAWGNDMVLWFAIVLNVVFALSFLLVPTPLGLPPLAVEDGESADDAEPSTPEIETDAVEAEPAAPEKESYLEFLQHNIKLVFVVLGFALASIGPQMCMTYGILIVERVGGGTAELGIAVAASAFMELPIMWNYSWLEKRFGVSNLMRVSAVGYVFKGAMVAFASSIPMVYAGYMLQLISGALFIPSNVAYGNRFFGEGDKNKALGLLLMANTIGGMVGNLFGGMVLDAFGLQTLLVGAVALSCVGAVLALMGIVDKPQGQEDAA